jgi:hypothetical protein
LSIKLLNALAVCSVVPAKSLSPWERVGSA